MCVKSELEELAGHKVVPVTSHTFVLLRFFGFNLRAIASPVNSSQLRAIPHNCAQFENSCVQFRTVARNSAQLPATELRLETQEEIHFCRETENKQFI